MMEKILVFGINGFTGKHFQEYVAKQNLSDDYNFIGVDKNIDRDAVIECTEEDLLAPKKVEEIVRRESPDYILNFVGLFNSIDFEALLNANAGISQRALGAVLKHELQVKKVLLVGSAAEYGPQYRLPITEESVTNPVSLYGLTKVVQTQYALFYNRNRRQTERRPAIQHPREEPFPSSFNRIVCATDKDRSGW